MNDYKQTLEIVVAYQQHPDPIESLLHDFNQDMSDQIRGRGMVYHSAHWLAAYKILCYAGGFVPHPAHVIQSGEYIDLHCGTFSDYLGGAK
ncbi:MAG: hypothetical protein KDA17_07085 [Candidatus Saccharibacteria bacterium]|nr:hypothetical protein [Candidatus Saccharibacteria bacterium]